MIPEAVVEAAAAGMAGAAYGLWELVPEPLRRLYLRDARLALKAAAPHMLADILEDAANTAETDELTTAAEVIYDLRRHAKDLRPASGEDTAHGNH